VKIGADPLGGASVGYWGEIADRHRLDLTVVNAAVDPRWAFMPLDTDGKIRMDCSSPAAMANLIKAMAGGPAMTSPPATTPTPTATGSSPPTAG
jgi:phosphoglucomutase